MSEYRRLGFEELCDRLTEPAPTLIIFHDRPDGDATGSAFGLRLLLEAMGSVAYCVCSDEVKQRYRFVFDGEYASVAPEAVPSEFVPGRVISVDTASPAQMQGLSARMTHPVDIMIDHHGRGEPYADFYVDPNAAACGEIMYDVAEELLRRGSIASLPSGFSLLTYMAIATDTGCFKYSNTTPETHRRVARLMDGSFDYAKVNFRLFDCRSADEIKVVSAAHNALRLYCDGKVAVVALDHAAVSSLDAADSFDGLIDTARSIEGVEVALSLRQTSPEPLFRVSARSNGDADVSALCAEFGGGGHVKAAGCSVHAESADEAVEKLLQTLKKLL